MGQNQLVQIAPQRADFVFKLTLHSVHAWAGFKHASGSSAPGSCWVSSSAPTSSSWVCS